MSKGLGIDSRILMGINLIGDICRPHGCSTLLLPDGKGGSILGHNLDWPDFELAHMLSITLILNANNGDYILPGFIGVSSCAMGINPYGVCVVLHDSHTHTPYDIQKSVPLGLSLRDCLDDSETAKELINRMADLQFAHGCMLIALDKKSIWLLEHGKTYKKVRCISDSEKLYRTNHFLEIPISNEYEESIKRINCLINESDKLLGDLITTKDLINVLCKPGIFRPLNNENSRTGQGATLHTMAYHSTTGEFHSEITTQYPTTLPEKCVKILGNKI